MAVGRILPESTASQPGAVTSAVTSNREGIEEESEVRWGSRAVDHEDECKVPTGLFLRAKDHYFGIILSPNKLDEMAETCLQVSLQYRPYKINKLIYIYSLKSLYIPIFQRQ